MGTYHWLRLRSTSRDGIEGARRLSERSARRTGIWGAFSGVFGIGSTELVLVVHAEDGTPLPPVADAGFEIVEGHELVATVRPERFEPLTRPGLYVFRFFAVDNADIDEIARLSDEAWSSFEHGDGYAAEAKGLFAPADRSAERGTMVLTTWYDGLGSWEASRRSPPEAAAAFRRRRALTHGTIAYATRLVTTSTTGRALS